MSVKGGITKLITLLNVVWGSTESGTSKEINTIDDADPKTIGVRAGLTSAEVEAASYVEVSSGEDISGNAAFQNKKFFQGLVTFRGDTALPILKNLIFNTSEAFESFIRLPNSRKIILAEMTIAEHVEGFTATGGFMLREDDDYILREDGGKIVRE